MRQEEKIVKESLSFYKSTFDNTFGAMVIIQEQTEKMVDLFLEQNAWFPEDGRKAVKDWASAYKKGRTEFKKAVDESFEKIEGFFGNPGKTIKPEK
ncbi:MAG: hypothetical protein ABSB79_11565 [Syntrophales bacterium]